MLQELIKPSFANTSFFINIGNPANKNILIDWHFHEEIEILWVQGDTQNIFIDNNNYVLHKDDIIFIDEYVPHKTHARNSDSKFLLQFSLPHFITHSSFLPQKKRPPFVIFPKGNPINTLLLNTLNSIESEYTQQEQSFSIFIQAYIYTILAIFYRNDILIDPTNISSNDDILRLMPVFEFVQQHYSENISIETASQLLPVNKSYFCRLFKKCTGISFMEYLYQIRLNVAENLLLHSDKNITEIAFEVGFLSPAYFTKIFREHKGYPPSFYKKLQKG